MSYLKADEDKDNPRMQCDRCGKWGRLYKNEEQYFFPGYISDDIYVEIYHDICQPCEEALAERKKDLELAYQAGKEHPDHATP
jgi:hypothetical protein